MPRKLSVPRTLLSCLVPALLLTATTPGVSQQPVHWRLARASERVVPPGGRLGLSLSAAIDAGWHIYSLTQPTGGPFATRITVSEGGPLRLDGVIQAPPPERLDDLSFGMVIQSYRRAVTFRLAARLAGNPLQDTAVVLVRYQACNGRICLLPRTDSVRLPLAQPVRKS